MQGYDLIVSQGKAACAVADYAARAGVPIVRFVAGTYLVSALLVGRRQGAPAPGSATQPPMRTYYEI